MNMTIITCALHLPVQSEQLDSRSDRRLIPIFG